MVYLIRVYPSFTPRTLESLRCLATFTLEALKLAATLWILFFILTGIHVIFGGIGSVTMGGQDLLLFFIGMVAYAICVLGVLAKRYFVLLSKAEEENV